MGWWRFVSVIVIFVFCLSCTGPMSDADVEAEAHMLLKTDRAWAEAAAAGDVEKLTTFWAEDATNYFPSAPAARGKEAIGELVRRNRSQPGFSLSWKPQEAVVARSLDLGYTSGTFALSMDGPEATPITRTGHYVCIWRKQADGTWKCSVESTIFGPGAGATPLLTEATGKIQQKANLSGTLTPTGPPDTTPVRVDAGESCIVDLTQAYTLAGSLSGTVVFNYRILVKGPCGSPIGTYDEEWIAYGEFKGAVNEKTVTGMMSYMADVKASGDVDGEIVLGQGISGNLHVTGNFEDGKLLYTGMLKLE